MLGSLWDGPLAIRSSTAEDGIRVLGASLRILRPLRRDALLISFLLLDPFFLCGNLGILFVLGHVVFLISFVLLLLLVLSFPCIKPVHDIMGLFVVGGLELAELLHVADHWLHRRVDELYGIALGGE